MDQVAPTPATSTNVTWHAGDVTRERRWALIGGRGVTVWLTGLSGAGKSTVADHFQRLLAGRGLPSQLLDGDNLRHGLNGDLGFTREDRDENVRRVAEVAALFADAGLVAVVPLISPYRAARQRAREVHERWDLPFVEVHVSAPLEVCEERDPKGLYQRARAGQVGGMTGVDDAYEPPTSPELVIDTTALSPEEAAATIAGYLVDAGALPPTATP